MDATTLQAIQLTLNTKLLSNKYLEVTSNFK